jgi:hypothetical protein
MGLFDKPIGGLKPADSITISLATAIGVAAIYGARVGPLADVHATIPGDPNMRAAIAKAGWQSLLLVSAITLLARDLNVAILGGGAIIFEHISHEHAEMSSPATGKLAITASAYQDAAVPATAG